MREVGLCVIFDGKKNVIMDEGNVYEYPIGGLACDYARLHPMELKEIILANPLFHETDLREKGVEATMSFYEALKEKYGIVIATMVITEFSSCFADFNRMSEDEFAEEIAGETFDLSSKVAEFILADTGYSCFGLETIGQALLTAYCSFAMSYVTFKHCFNILASEEEVDDKTASAFWGFYAENAEFQNIGFTLMYYDGAFHSAYTIKQSISLILFEAAHLIDANIKLKRCKNCKEYFVPVGRSDTVYCGYPSPQDKTKTCRDVGAKETRAKMLKNDTVAKEYRRLYMRLTMAVKRHPDDSTLQEQLNVLTEGMKEKRRLRDAGSISSDDILEWLASMDDK